jgi:cell division protein FtsI (penicillin-binding protein 3)
LLGYAVLTARAVQLQSLDAGSLAARAQQQHRATLEVGVRRGDVADRDGDLLAKSATVQSVAASPRRIRDRAGTSRALASVLGLRRASLTKQLATGRSFVWVRRWVTPSQAEAVRALGLEGVELVPERRRFYPNGELAAPYLGFAGRDDVGLSGVELAFEKALRSSPRRVEALRDEFGHKLVRRPDAFAARSNRRLVLALDTHVQHVAERALDRALERSRARHGSLVALDPWTGDVLALAERPAFDPNLFWQASPSAYRARAFSDAFEPGSTLKPFVIAIALETGAVSATQPFDCENGRWRVRDRTIRDYKPHGVLSVHDILRVSSNIGAAKIADRVGSGALADGLRAFGFGAPSGSGFPGEAAGVVRSLRETQAVERANLAFGQGMTATALQLATAGSLLANGGRRVWPRMALRLETDGERLDWPSGIGDRMLSEQTSRRVIEMMVDVVENGTGRAAAIPGYRIAGKTGTAQKVIHGRYSDEHYVASFLGIAPADRPRLVVAVVIDEPQGVRTGGAIAAPVFRELASFALSHLPTAPEAGRREVARSRWGAE